MEWIIQNRRTLDKEYIIRMEMIQMSADISVLGKNNHYLSGEMYLYSYFEKAIKEVVTC